MTSARAGAAIAGALLLAFPANASPLSPPRLVTAQADGAFKSEADGSLAHVQSGFLFPARLAGLDRTGDHVFQPDDVSARYGMSTPTEPWLDLYVYPAQGPLADEAADVGQIIVDSYSATPLPQARPLPQSAADGRSQWYSAQFAGRAVTTGYVLVRRGGWSVKVRATSPQAAGSDGIGKLLDAIDAIGWGWAPARAPAGDERAIAQR